MTRYIASLVNFADARVLNAALYPDWLISYYQIQRLSKKRSPGDVISDFLALREYAKDSIFMLDSGAYSAWSQGVNIDLFEYTEFVKTYGHHFSHIVTLDVIDDPNLSEAHYRFMRYAAGDGKLIPVFHAGEPEVVLEMYLSDNRPYIGISPNNDWANQAKLTWLRRIFSRYPIDCLTHGFGYSATTGAALLYSVDSVTWKITAAYGNIWTPYGTFYVSEWEKKGRVEKIACDYVNQILSMTRLTPEDLAGSYRDRCLFNITSMAKFYPSLQQESISELDLFDDSTMTFGYCDAYDEELVKCTADRLIQQWESKHGYKGTEGLER